MFKKQLMTIPSMLTHLSMIRTIPSSYRARSCKGDNICGCRIFTEKRCLKTNGRKGNQI